MEKYNASFTQYVEVKFKKEITEYIKEKYPNYFPKGENELFIRSVRVRDYPGLILFFEVVIALKGSKYHNSFIEVYCRADLSKELRDFKVLDSCPFKKLRYSQRYLSDSLVPIIKKEALDHTALIILKRYYPNALSKDHQQIFEPTKLIKKLGLKLKTRRLSQESSTLGVTIFTKTKLPIYETSSGKLVEEIFEARTILIDPSARTKSSGSFNTTLTHECIHWILHQKAFLFSHLFEKELGQLIQKENNFETSTVDWLEWQANALTPRIQMPVDSLKVKVNELRKIYHYLNPGINSKIQEMIYLIDSVVNFYHVSKLSAKIRLEEIGIKEVKGIYKFVNGRYVKPYVFKQVDLSKAQTYSLSIEQAFEEWKKNMNLRDKLSSGLYCYVDSHFCLNNPRYIMRNPKEKVALTNYARHHIDECCLKFDVTKSNKGVIQKNTAGLFREANSGLH